VGVAKALFVGTTANIAGVLSTTSPNITTSITTPSTSFDLINATATTLNLAGAATAVNVGAATGTMTVANTTLAAKAITASTTLGVTGAATLSSTLTYGGVTLTNAVTGTGKMVLSASPTLTGTIAGASLSLSSLTSGRVPYATTAGLLTDAANMAYDGNTLTLKSDTTVPTLSVLSNSGTPNLRLGSQGNTAVYWQIGRDNVTTGDFIVANQTSEKMRIDSSGNMFVGATSGFTGSKFYVAGVAGASNGNGIFGVASTTTGDTAYPVALFSKFDGTTNTSAVFIRFSISANSAASGQINANGVSAAAFGSWSDRRLKENITELPSQLANIMALRPVEFDYIESEGGGHQIGFIAQDVQEIYPDLVGERSDGMLTLTDMNKNDARLIKCIQEQQALITALTARITALENK